MKKVSLVVSKELQNNNIFNKEVHRDNTYHRFIKLKEAYFTLGYDLSTSDINKINESEIVIYSANMPNELPTKDNISKSFIILTESHFIRPDNYDIKKHSYFKKIFTWHDDLIDNEKYIKLNYAHKFPKSINKDTSGKSGLCTLISANKLPPHTKENDLYSERVNAIRWFENNHPEDFDLYGIGWDRYIFSGPKIIRAMNRIPIIQKLYLKLTSSTFHSYKGAVSSKFNTLSKYKFSICFENAKDIPGYITEKIFDSFFASCVPIYWGANNILEHIPKSCFIDIRDFKNFEELYHFIKNMPEKEFINYLNEIEKYLKSNKSLPFKSEGFVKTIIKNTLP